MHGLWALTLRSLRSDSRLLRFDLLRLAVGALAVLMISSTLDDSISGTAPGRTLLLAMLQANLAFVTWGGILLFAPTITSENEAGTLGLLRLTGIGPASLILGSCIPKLTQMGLILLVQVPLLCLTVTLGGVNWSHLWAAFLLVGTQLIFVATGSLLASVMARTSGRAIAAVLIIVMLWSESLRVGLQFLGPSWSTLSISQHVQRMLASGASSQRVEFAVLFHLGLSAIWMLLAIRLFDRFNLHEMSGESVPSLWQRALSYVHIWVYRNPNRTTPQFGSSPATGSPLEPSASQRPTVAVWQNSLAWKDFFLLGGGRAGFLLRSVAAFLGVLGIAIANSPSPSSAWIGESILGTSLKVLAVDAIYLTVNLFGSELRNQTWESLQMLPLRIGVICRQKVLGAACHLVPWMVTTGLGALMTGLPGKWLDDLMRDPLSCVLITFHAIVQIVTVFLTLTLLSLRLNPWTATFASVVIHGAILFAVIISALTTFGIFGPPAPPWKIALYNLLWASGVALYGALCERAIRRRLDPGAVEWSL